MQVRQTAQRCIGNKGSFRLRKVADLEEVLKAAVAAFFQEEVHRNFIDVTGQDLQRPLDPSRFPATGEAPQEVLGNPILRTEEAVAAEDARMARRLENFSLVDGRAQGLEGRALVNPKDLRDQLALLELASRGSLLFVTGRANLAHSMHHRRGTSSQHVAQRHRHTHLVVCNIKRNSFSEKCYAFRAAKRLWRGVRRGVDVCDFHLCF
mmetsp:Transcript_47839/g.89553  ORF Transcript_47839/g.89553 Transcript_47839/m.89553 type:complete len:208 (+) Transcript_47839:825-1448(+)